MHAETLATRVFVVAKPSGFVQFPFGKFSIRILQAAQIVWELGEFLSSRGSTKACRISFLARSLCFSRLRFSQNRLLLPVGPSRGSPKQCSRARHGSIPGTKELPEIHPNLSAPCRGSRDLEGQGPGQSAPSSRFTPWRYNTDKGLRGSDNEGLG